MATIKTSPFFLVDHYLNQKRWEHKKYRGINMMRVIDVKTGFDGVHIANWEFPLLRRVEFDLRPYSWDRDHTRMISAFRDALEKAADPIWRKF